MITIQKIKVTTYSYVFQDTGIFVFRNNVSNALTIISVVGAGQQCAGADGGVSASMVTKESLSKIGVKAYDKQIQPNWAFIIMSFISINSFLYMFIGLFIWSYNMAQAQGKLSSKAQSENTLYYDKLGEQDSDDTK
jgi:hypothetical protein